MKNSSKVLKTIKNLIISPSRLNRVEYFLRSILLMVCISVTTLFFSFIHDYTAIHKNNYLYLKLFFDFIVLPPIAIAICIAIISMLVARLHDLNKGAVWLVLVFLMQKIPFVGPAIVLLVFNFWPGTKGSNKFGEQPKTGEELLAKYRSK